MRRDPLPASVWLRWLPHGLVCLAAFGVAVGGVAQLADNGGLGLGAAWAIGLAQGGAPVLALRRPLAAWWMSLTLALVCAVAVHGGLGVTPGVVFSWPWTAAGIIAHLLVLLLLALRVRARAAVEALALTALLTWALEGGWGGTGYQPTGVAAVVLSAVVVALGIAVRGRQEARAELVEQTTLTAEERARRTLLEERSRIARELHDVVAHHMSVISIQAQVAPHLVERPPPELIENLAGIRQNALEALTELRRVLGVLRSEHPEDPEGPYGLGAPGTGAAGMEVTAEVRGRVRPYTPGVELSAYRIVQEALSNALRHAPGSTVRVEVAHRPDGLHLEIVNSRPREAVPPSPGVGHGLLGMRERAAMLGGRVTAAATPQGGFAVPAFLPGDGTPQGGPPPVPLPTTGEQTP
ncbi:sensor histidine kinase [Streptomyces misionensis]|uniref:histidine kinase n=1 Tax=Streptomyces misionensis TaxID=67331 RepID=A0A5C6JYE3_9ACTN|nr:sensor histidine kinase [Streptomyces misionensis]TWV50751.1 sensor histidine kinase [Streptomyces misionensis]